MNTAWIPYATGALVTVSGSVLQWLYLNRYRAEVRPVQQRLEMAGDQAQLICTAVSVLPAAIVLTHGSLLVITVSVTLAVVAVGVVYLSDDDRAPYYTSHRFLDIFMPVSWVSFAFCMVGLAFSL